MRFFVYVMRFLGISIFFLLSFCLTACGSFSPEEGWKEKVKFDLAALEEVRKSHLHGYAFCIPNEPMLVEQVRQIHPDLEVIDQPDDSCSPNHYYCTFSPVSPAHLTHLKRIAQFSYIEEVHPIWKPSQEN
ncbi:MAG: hypothetical protein AAFY71_18050 [Bacteroidota bacterium]